MNFAIEDHVLGAMRAWLKGALVTVKTVELGWPADRFFAGNEEGDIVMSLEAGTVEEEPHAGVLRSFTVPDPEDEEPTTEVVVDHGSARLPLTLNVWCASRRNGKTLRSSVLRELRDAMLPEPGEAEGIEIELSDVAGSMARITWEGFEVSEDAEGTERDLWRAIVRLDARVRLAGTREFGFARELQVLCNDEAPTRVADVVVGEET